MIRSGQVALLRFPRADLATGKLRPVLVVCPVPGRFDDWLVCMISSQLRQAVAGFDEMIESGDADFDATGLKVPSAVRLGRLAVVERAVLEGSIGEIAPARLSAVSTRLARWIEGLDVAEEPS